MVTEISFCVSDKSKVFCLCVCMEKITVNHRLEVVVILVTRKHSHAILFNKATVLGKRQSEWDLNGI